MLKKISLYVLASFLSLFVLFYCLIMTSLSRGAGEGFFITFKFTFLMGQSISRFYIFNIHGLPWARIITIWDDF